MLPVDALLDSFVSRSREILGGEWGLSHLPERFHSLLRAALNEYETGEAGSYDEALAAEYAQFMLDMIGAPEQNR